MVATPLPATGTHMPHGITQCYLPLGKGVIPAFTLAKLVLDSLSYFTDDNKTCRIKFDSSKPVFFFSVKEGHGASKL